MGIMAILNDISMQLASRYVPDNDKLSFFAKLKGEVVSWAIGKAKNVARGFVRWVLRKILTDKSADAAIECVEKIGDFCNRFFADKCPTCKDTRNVSGEKCSACDGSGKGTLSRIAEK